MTSHRQRKKIMVNTRAKRMRQTQLNLPPRASRSSAAVSRGNQNNSISLTPHSDPVHVFDDSESETPMMQSPPLRRPRKSPLNQNQSRVEVETLSSSENDIPRSAKRRKVVVLSDSENRSDGSPITHDKATPRSRKRSKLVIVSDSEYLSDGSPIKHGKTTLASKEDEEDEDELPVRRNRLNAQNSSDKSRKHTSKQDQADLDEDLEFLDDADTSTPRVMRDRGWSQIKSAKRLALEALKERRLNRDIWSSQRTAINDEVDTDPDSPPDSKSNPEASEPVESDFIVEDDSEDALGGPVELPFQFSQYRTMKPQALFQFVVEWMVQKKINPAFDMQGNVYQIAFDRLDNFVKGMGGSKFQSSAWTPTFSRMLNGRPTLVDQQHSMESLSRDRCDACNRSGHPATWEARFTGQAYDKNSLEEDSEDEDGNNNDAKEETPVFYIGKICMRNARTAHALAHWKYHLKEWIVDYLKNKGELTADKIVQRDGWNTSKRRKDAERIVGEMDADGEIKNLHRDFKAEISEAHYAVNHAGGRERSSP